MTVSTGGTAGSVTKKYARKPTDIALQHGEFAVRRVGGREAPVRRDFVRGRKDVPPPLARLLRGGQSGEVRLKLYISTLLISAKPPHQTEFPARGWAEMLGLPDVGTNGARRITSAVAWLERNGFLRVERRGGTPSTLFLLDDAGSGAAYEPPWTVDKTIYIKVPSALWKNGWIATLSGTALALLLILLDLEKYHDPKKPIWISPDRAKDWYGLSPDTWTRGTAELKHHGIVKVDRIPVRADFADGRKRNSYKLILPRLDTQP